MATITDLKNCYSEATGVLIDFTKKARNKSGIKKRELDSLFSGSIWIEKKQAGGHRKLKNRITKVVVEYIAHKNDVDPGAVDTILSAVQEHLNILHSGIFSLSARGWKEPDYDASLRRWQALNP